MRNALFFFGATTVVGLLWAGRLSTLRGWGERIGVGLTIGLVIQLWLPFLTSKIFGGGIAYGPAVALVLAAGAALLGIRSQWAHGEISGWNALASAFLARCRTRS